MACGWLSIRPKKASIFKACAEVLLVAASHFPAVMALRLVGEKNGSRERFAVTEEYWRWEPLAAVLATDGYFFSL